MLTNQNVMVTFIEVFQQCTTSKLKYYTDDTCDKS